LAIPVLRCSFGIVNGHKKETQKMDRKKKTRKMPTILEQHHPRADADRVNIPRKEGGRELMQIEGAYITEIMKVTDYVESKEYSADTNG
jgi:hypothetical protein